MGCCGVVDLVGWGGGGREAGWRCGGGVVWLEAGGLWVWSLWYEGGRKCGGHEVGWVGGVELVIFGGGGEERGGPCSRGNRKVPKHPDLSCR